MPRLPHNRDLKTQMRFLCDTVVRNRNVAAILEHAQELGMPNWYLGAGCIAQTLWNEAHAFDPAFGIRDYDLVYFDSSDLSYDGENAFIEKAQERFGDLGVTVEVRNQARVHLWYKKHFGYSIAPYQSVEEAIGTWPTTATTIGISQDSSGEMRVCAPLGLDDLMRLMVRPNKVQVTKEIYLEKAARWVRIWPKLKVMSWD